MKKNICIYTLGRSGSNYLCTFINQPNYTLINEPFTLSSRHNAAQFLVGLGLLYQKNQIHLPQLKDLISITIDMQSSKNISKTKLLDNNLLKLWFKAIQEEKSENILWKFMSWYDDIFDINIYNMFDIIDYLILNYRKNILKQWISYIKASISGEWVTETKSINKDMKIVWDKKQYLNFVVYTEKNHVLMKENFNLCNKPKTIVCYEDLSGSGNEQQSYLTDLFKKSNIDLPINSFSKLQKQSDGNKSIEDNFSNKQEFLDDYDSIKDKILTTVAFD